MELTASQRQAVERPAPLLVSAAAGSGKTRVLVERLLRRVEQGADIDEFLVITFTRAAAAELRSRILSALNQRLAAEPGNRRMRRQAELCCRADIGTIDSICGRILRENVHLTALPPDFRVMEAERSDSLRRAVLDRVLEAAYETLEQDADLRALVDSVGAGRDDGRLTALVLRLHDALLSHPDPAAWAEECRSALRCGGLADAGATPWGAWLLSVTASRARYWASRLEDELTTLRLPEHALLFAAYGDSLAETAEALRGLERCCAQGWDTALACLPIPFPRFKGFRGEDGEKARATALRDNCKKLCKKIGEDLSAPSALLLAELEGTQGAMEALLELTLRLDAAYAAEKQRLGLVDFADQEHMALRLLEAEENGVRAELSRRWREVMVDEYQDVNRCQDRLFALLSGDGERLFMVGDVKQSIYRFRLADPGIFLEKYRSCARGEGSLVLLRENFRSSGGVIRAVNHVFENLLSQELGEMPYDEGARLIPGREAAPEEQPVRLSILSVPGAEEDEERPDALALEAAMVARQIRELVESGAAIPDGTGRRPLGYGDIAILLRSQKAPGAVFRAALEREGVPAVAQQGGGFFRSTEVTVLLSLLSVIDNPRQDVPLIAVLRSPLYGFTPDELADIRQRDKEADFFTALERAAEDREKCARFLAELEEYRLLAPDLSVEGLLEWICAKSDAFALLSALPEGHVRRENVQMLLDLAGQYEQTGYRGLFGFVNWMKRLSQRGEEPRTGEVNRADAVQILSVHRSKGLEFPVVFLCNANRQFNMSDLRSVVLVHPELGLGSKVTDGERGIEYPGLAWRAIASRLRRESLSEELRVLYVAMTRARERLYVSWAWSEPEKKLERLAEGLTSPIAPQLLEGDVSPAAWLGRCALLGNKALEMRICLPPPPGAPAEAAPAEAAAQPSLGLAERLSWTYPWAGNETLPSKLTATTRRTGAPTEGEAAALAEEPRPPRRPVLGRTEAPLTGSERGSAVHLALQLIDLARVGSREAIEAELERLQLSGHLTKKQAAAVEPDWLLDFFRSPLGRRILRADRVWREQRFTLLLDAGEVCPGAAGEEILLQGIVDCCIREGDALTIIDYKTDYVTPETAEQRGAYYASQVRTYAAAMRRILGLEVRQAVLVFLRLGQCVTLEGAQLEGE